MLDGLGGSAPARARRRAERPEPWCPLRRPHGRRDPVDGPDPDDAPHIAAAIAGNATTVVTADLADFAVAQLAAHGIAVVAPDTYLCAVLDDAPAEVLVVLEECAATKRRPPLTMNDVLDALDRAGVHESAARARALL